MAEICCGLINEEESSPVESRVARRRRMEIRRFKYVSGGYATTTTSTAADSINTNISAATANAKRPKIMDSASPASSSSSQVCDDGYDKIVANSNSNSKSNSNDDNNNSDDNDSKCSNKVKLSCADLLIKKKSVDVVPRFGIATVCGRRRDMEDAVAVHLCFAEDLHYFGVYDGHGCSHVASKCKERLHELVKEEIDDVAVPEWRFIMEKSFGKMDKEVIACTDGVVIGKCRCELQTPECDAVGSTAVVAIVDSDKIIVANCGDSRAVLCRNGKAFPLSSDHKPDRPDELNRIQEAGGRVIYWDGPRVLGVLAMSRAIGDNYLKPYVSCEPEVTITDRTSDDDCLILASDGLWDVVSNDTACGVARMCLQGKVPSPAQTSEFEQNKGGTGESVTDQACEDASMLLTKLALARHSSDNVSVVVINLRKDA